MVGSTSFVSRRGLTDWLIQRFSALYLLFCLLGLFGYIFLHPGLSYPDWLSLFSGLWVRVLTLLFFVSLLLHAWVGIWTVLTDYVTCGCLRVFLEGVVLFLLAGFFFAAILILWGI